MKRFVPGITPPLEIARRIVFLVSPAGIAIREDVEVEDAHYLGRLDDAEAFAAEGAHPQARSLRSLYGTLDEVTFAVAGRAAHVIDWATTHRFCGRCGTPTVRDPNERAMRCPSCELVVYPRIAPAVIVLVRTGEQALLARGARFPLPFYSTLAGFSEVGESLEETLVREVREEVGVEIENVRYFGSQPWPYPHSLMIGFFADYAGGEIRPDGSEVIDARWFSADALPLVPPPLSIARQLIDTWVREVTS
ncbi:MAG: NAD(+) diphosphatase [Polyangiales bacterium]